MLNANFDLCQFCVTSGHAIVAIRRLLPNRFRIEETEGLKSLLVPPSHGSGLGSATAIRGGWHGSDKNAIRFDAAAIPGNLIQTGFSRIPQAQLNCNPESGRIVPAIGGSSFLEIVMTLRVLTVSDIHRSRRHYHWLARAVKVHKPDLVALVGDFLGFDAISESGLLSTQQVATALSGLAAPHLVFVRGNHEQGEWRDLVCTWPMQKRPLVALYGSTFKLGPLVIVGFPCHLGWEGPWCQTLPRTGNELSRDRMQSGREELPINHTLWLPQLLRKTGSAGRALWLMHEPPMTQPLATPQTCNPEWCKAVKRFRPLLVVSGHDHRTPQLSNAWHGKLGNTICVNPGQSTMKLHYCVLDYEFAGTRPALPCRITVEAFPWSKKIVIYNPHRVPNPTGGGAASAPTKNKPEINEI